MNHDVQCLGTSRVAAQLNKVKPCHITGYAHITTPSETVILLPFDMLHLYTLRIILRFNQSRRIQNELNELKNHSN